MRSDCRSEYKNPDALAACCDMMRGTLLHWGKAQFYGVLRTFFSRRKTLNYDEVMLLVFGITHVLWYLWAHRDQDWNPVRFVVPPCGG